MQTYGITEYALSAFIWKEVECMIEPINEQISLYAKQLRSPTFTKYIRYYNTGRYQIKLNFMTPMEYHKAYSVQSFACQHERCDNLRSWNDS